MLAIKYIPPLIFYMQKLSLFEEKILNLILRKESSWHNSLRRQIPFLRIEERKISDIGAFINFTHEEGIIPANIIVGEDSSLSINSEIKGIPESIVTFIIWVDENALINQLEIVALTDHTLPFNNEEYCNFKDDYLNLIMAQ